MIPLSQSVSLQHASQFLIKVMNLHISLKFETVIPILSVTAFMKKSFSVNYDSQELFQKQDAIFL